MPKGWKKDKCFICKAAGVNWVSANITTPRVESCMFCWPALKAMTLTALRFRSHPRRSHQTGCAAALLVGFQAVKDLWNPILCFCSEVIQKAHTSFSQGAPFPNKSPIAIHTKQRHSWLQHGLGKARVPSARSAQRTPSQKIMTPRSVNNVHRAARHLQVPPPTPAAFATSEFWTIEPDSGLFIQLGSVLSATACFKKSARSTVW